MGWIGFSSLLILVLLIHGNEKVNGARILGLFPLPLKGHFVMCERLMRALADRGHQVDVVSSFPLKNPPPNYRDISLADVLPPFVNNLTLEIAEGYNTRGISNILAAKRLNVCETLGSPQMKRLIEHPPTDPPYDLIVNEQINVDCYMAFSRRFKVPIVGIVTSKLYDWMALPMGNPESLAFVPSIFSDFEQKMSFVERLKNTVLSHYLKLIYWLDYAPQQLAKIDRHFGLKVTSLRELWRDVALLLVNTHPSFDLVRPTVPAIVEVGGLHITEDDQDLSPEVEKWMDESTNGFVYASLGSMLRVDSFPEEFVRALYSGFESIAPVRVLMKMSEINDLPLDLPINVMTRPWLPQTKILRHKNVKLFVTHCGLMSTQEAITYGVPMIGIPVCFDQRLNALLCQRKNAMIPLDYRKLTEETFARALNGVLRNDSYRENMGRLSKLFTDRPMSPLDTAIFWVEYVIRNGNVLRTPTDHLSWWQIELFDVYAVIVVALSLAVLVIKRMIGASIRLSVRITQLGKGQPQYRGILGSKDKLL